MAKKNKVKKSKSEKSLVEVALEEDKFEQPEEPQVTDADNDTTEDRKKSAEDDQNNDTQEESKKLTEINDFKRSTEDCYKEQKDGPAEDEDEPKDTITQLEYPKPSKSLKNLDKGHAQERKASGIYSQLSQDQINVLRDAFSLIDDDGDGIISDEDLVKAYKLINKEVSKEQRTKMFSDVQSPLAFGGFLSSLAGKLGELSSKEELTNAFEVFSTDQRTYKNQSYNQQHEKKEELKCSVRELKDSLLQAGMKEEDINLALKSFSKTEMNGTEIFLAERFINTVRDD